MAKTDYSRAMAYYRLSKEDKAKEVSDSIENQRKLIREYVSRQENITLVVQEIQAPEKLRLQEYSPNCTKKLVYFQRANW